MAPTFVLDRENGASLAGVDFNFDSLGEKYLTRSPASLASIISSHMTVSRVNPSIITEGGSIEVDGRGTLLVTRSSILNDIQSLLFYRKSGDYYNDSGAL
ncbi:agmatine deiminase [Metarhizium brunneum]